MAGVRDKAFLFFVAFRHRADDPLGIEEDHKEEQHISGSCRDQTDEEEFFERFDLSSAVKKGNARAFLFRILHIQIIADEAFRLSIAKYLHCIVFSFFLRDRSDTVDICFDHASVF